MSSLAYEQMSGVNTTHFLSENNKAELIQRVRNVDVILDHLGDILLTTYCSQTGK